MLPKDAREKRGLTVYAAVKLMDGVRHQSLRNLEARPELGTNLRLATALEIVRVYWPDVQLNDLVPKTDFALRSLDGNP